MMSYNIKLEDTKGKNMIPSKYFIKYLIEKNILKFPCIYKYTHLRVPCNMICKWKT